MVFYFRGKFNVRTGRSDGVRSSILDGKVRVKFCQGRKYVPRLTYTRGFFFLTSEMRYALTLDPWVDEVMDFFMTARDSSGVEV